MRLRLVATAAIAAAAVAGCASGGDTGSTTPTTNNEQAAVAYMDKVCGAASEFAKVDKTPPKAEQGTEPAKLKADMAAYMGQLADAFTKSANGLKGVGPSPVAGGDAAVTQMTEAFTALGATFTDAKAKIDAADANDQNGGLQAAGEAIAKLSELANPLKNLEAVPELQKAAQTAQKCQEMQRLNVSPTG